MTTKEQNDMWQDEPAGGTPMQRAIALDLAADVLEERMLKIGGFSEETLIPSRLVTRYIVPWLRARARDIRVLSPRLERLSLRLEQLRALVDESYEDED